MNSAEKEAVLHCLKVTIDEALCEDCPLYGTTGTYLCEKDCARLAINALSSSENQNKWIPVSERLPETTDYYLVTVGINEYGLMIPSVRTALYNAKTKDFTVHTGTNMSIVEDVVAWCDCLPKPYQSEIPTDSKEENE